MCVLVVLPLGIPVFLFEMYSAAVAADIIAVSLNQNVTRAKSTVCCVPSSVRLGLKLFEISLKTFTHTPQTHTHECTHECTHTHTHTVEKCLYCKFCQTKPKSRWQMQINDNRMLYLCTSTICTLSQ